MSHCLFCGKSSPCDHEFHRWIQFCRCSEIVFHAVPWIANALPFKTRGRGRGEGGGDALAMLTSTIGHKASFYMYSKDCREQYAANAVHTRHRTYQIV